MSNSKLSADNYSITYGYSKPMVEKCYYIWTLEMFEEIGKGEEDSEIRSTWFSSVNGECRWVLKLTPHDDTEVAPRVLVELMISENPENLAKFSGTCTFRNSKGEDVDNPRNFSGSREDYSSFIIYSLERQRLLDALHDGVLKICVEIKAMLEVITTDSTPAILENRVPIHMLDLLKNKNFSDLMVTTTDGTSFAAHKCVLAARSPIFQAMLETDVTETPVDTMELPGLKVAIVEALLDFVYSGKLGDVNVTTAIDLASAALTYQIPDLVDHCAGILSSQMDNRNVTEFYEAAERCKALELKEKCLGFINNMNGFSDDNVREQVAKPCLVYIENDEDDEAEGAEADEAESAEADEAEGAEADDNVLDPSNAFVSSKDDLSCLFVRSSASARKRMKYGRN